MDSTLRSSDKDSGSHCFAVLNRARGEEKLWDEKESIIPQFLWEKTDWKGQGGVPPVQLKIPFGSLVDEVRRIALGFY